MRNKPVLIVQFDLLVNILLSILGLSRDYITISIMNANGFSAFPQTSLIQNDQRTTQFQFFHAVTTYKTKRNPDLKIEYKATQS
jgi:hypothetical protein